MKPTDSVATLANRPWRLPDASTHQAQVRNTYCADVVRVGFTLEEGVIVDIGWDGHACMVCRASANVLAVELVGTHVEQLPSLKDVLQQALSGQDTGPFSAFASLVSAPSRHTCALLPFRALDDALHPSVGQGEGIAAAAAHADDAWTAVMAFRARGLSVALATLVDVVGSSPCPMGSHLVVADNGEFWGAVSGGCVESAVIQTARQILDGEARPGMHGYQIANSQAGEVGLPCGGQVCIHVGFAPGDAQLRQYAARGRGMARVLDVSTGREWLEPCDAPEPTLQGDVFTEPLTARPHLVLVGGTRIAQVLDTLARAVGFDVTIVEPREGFAGPGRFVGQVRQAFPGDVLPDLITRDTAVVMLTHDERLDDEGLLAALRSPAFYVGALGSRKTQRARLLRLGQAGLTAQVLQRLHGPAGLSLGAVGAEEIAVSILAQVVATRRKRQTGGVGTVVLAGGRSVRAGSQNKLLQPLRGVPMIRRVVQTACEALSGPCVVVLGHEAECVRAALQDLPVHFVMNDRFEQGMGTSVAAGVEALAVHDVQAALVVLGDMPYVSTESLRRIADAHTPATQHLVIVPVAGSGAARRRANPVLWPKRYFGDLMALTGDQGGKVILSKAPGAVLELLVDDAGLLQDVDLILT